MQNLDYYFRKFAFESNKTALAETVKNIETRGKLGLNGKGDDKNISQ